VATLQPSLSGASVLGGVAGSVLSAAAQAPLEQPLPAALKGLQFGNPAEGIDTVGQPTTDTMGEAHLSYPLAVPPGRLGAQPALSLDYGSHGGNGWLGMGWDLSVPSISVDTRWGVPHYADDAESETYSFEGEELSPNAHRPDQIHPRRADPAEFEKRVEGDFALIIRHGSSPATYWWELNDKLGNKYFYGRSPGDKDGNGNPVYPARLATEGTTGNGYWWGLRQMTDVSLNSVTYSYDRVSDAGVGDGQSGPKGEQLYLSRINYTGSSSGKSAIPAVGPYDVTFLRDSQLPGYSRRKDVTIDGREGALRVTAELLRRVDISYQGNPVRSYRLGYRSGAFDKTLLASVGQAGADGQVFATHTFDYYDDVSNGSGGYDGFTGASSWSTGNGDGVGENLLGLATSATALGGSTASGGDGSAYIGFNFFAGTKAGSVGGGIELNGSDSDGTVESMDINGDGLPDKVFRSGGRVYYRLNRWNEDHNTAFADAVRVDSLPHLSHDSDFGVSIGIESYVALSVMYHHGWSFSTTSSYFVDVNGDGLPDLIDNGTVLFNHLDKATGVPSFSPTSAGTDVPLGRSSAAAIDASLAPDLTAVAAAERQKAPLADTVRRWIAPWDGTVAVSAPVGVHTTSPDGVRVAIQKDGTELWSATIPGGDNALRQPANVGSLVVSKGDDIYFRVQSLDDGAGDQVDWDPVVNYLNVPPMTDPGRLDVNSRDVYSYKASDDFTLGGRPGIFVAMPFDGVAVLTGDVTKTRKTTDDVTVVVVRTDKDGVDHPVHSQKIPGAATGAFPVNVPGFTVSGGLASERDKVSVRLAVDSPIDVTALSWAPQLFYTSAFKHGHPEQTVRTQDGNGQYIIQLHPPFDVDLYPKDNLTSPQGWWTAPDNHNQTPGETSSVRVDVRAILSGNVDPTLLPTDVVATVKSRDGLVGKRALTLRPPLPPSPNTPPPPIAATDGFDVTVTEGQQYWFDFSTREPRIGDALTVDASIGGNGVPSAKHWYGVSIEPDAGDMFPQAFRGWGYAGFNGGHVGDDPRATHAMPEGDFVFHRSDYDQPAPTRADDPNFHNPIDGKAYAYAPDTAHNRWLGPKDAPPNATNGVAGATWGGPAGAGAS